MMQYEYKVSPLCYRKIYSFYHNVAKKYRHTYSEEMLHKNIDDAVNAIYQIERALLRREPTIARWRKYHMANADKWYFAYKIDGNTIKILDACHAQNMHNNNIMS